MTIRAPYFSNKLPREVQPPQLIPNLLVTTLLVAAPDLLLTVDWQYKFIPRPQQ